MPHVERGIVARHIAARLLALLVLEELFKVILEICIGQTVRIGYFSQENEELEENQRVIDAMTSIGEYVHTTDGLVSAGSVSGVEHLTGT